MTEAIKLTTQEICNKLKVNTNTRKYIEHKYKGKSMIFSTWKSKLKKDGYDL